jgi:hypothetical protein
MIHSIDYPLYTRLTAHSRPPSLRACFWLAFGVGIGATIVSAASFLGAPGPRSIGAQLLPALLALFTFISPLGVILLAASLTVQDVRSQAYELLMVTSVSNAQVVRSYVGAALQRVRIPLALMVGATPAIVIGMLEYNLRAFYPCAYVYTPIQFSTPPAICGLPPAHSALIWLPILAGAWGMNWLAAATGVWLGLRWRHTLPAMIAGTLQVVVAIYALIWFLTTQQDVTRLMWGWSMVWMLAPVGLAAMLMRLSERWVRRSH